MDVKAQGPRQGGTEEREGNIMLAYTYVEKGRFELLEKPKPVL